MDKRVRWTKEDEAMLEQVYNQGNFRLKFPDALTSRFSFKAIHTKASIMGLSVKNYWTEDDIEQLKLAYKNRIGRKPEIPRLLVSRHGSSGCFQKASELKLTSFFTESKTKLSTPEQVANAAYIAGIIDGEGCLDLGYSGNLPRLQISNTSFDLVEWLKKNIGAGFYIKEQRNTPKSKTCYVFVVSCASELIGLLKEVLPYLVIKRDKAIKAIQILEKTFRKRTHEQEEEKERQD